MSIMRDSAVATWDRIPEERRHLYWMTKKHIVLEIAKMVDSHLVNCIHFLRRGAPSRLHEVIQGAYQTLSYAQGYHAEKSMEEQLNHLEMMDPIEYLAQAVPQYQTMLKEAEKRGLDVSTELDSEPIDNETLQLAHIALLTHSREEG